MPFKGGGGSSYPRGAAAGPWAAPPEQPAIVAAVRILEKSVAERIAAGEVVERPASVIKELVENSLDAAASRITVELEGGGAGLIRVVDDGHGMSAEDARLAIERHATSKIAGWEDMEALHTLGFRGEALPSIAAVARLQILTCEAGAEAGTEVLVEGSELTRWGAAPAAPGTRITVRDLFFNTPARRKFLRSPAAETAQVVDLLGRLAAAYPEVAFRLVSQGKELLSFPVGLSTPERLSRIWRVPVERLVPIQGEGDGLSVEGWVGLPSESRPQRTAQLFIMNGRIVRSAALSQALGEGFTPMIERGRFPLAMVRLLVDPALVDVNVHPTKMEVRFAHPRPVFSALFRAVASGLARHGADTVAPRHLGGGLELPGAQDLVGGRSPGLEEPAPAREGASAAPLRVWEPDSTGPSRAPGSPARPGPPWRPAWSPPAPPIEKVLELFSPGPSEGVAEPAPGPRFQPLAQLHRTYVVGLVDGELWVIDQHTAHERIHYERLAGLAPLGERSQGLLTPELVELTPAAAEFLAGHLEAFRHLGFEVEPFGRDTFQLRGVPVGLQARRVQGAFRQLVEEAAEGLVSVKGSVPEQHRERLRAMVACKVSVKAGDPLTFAEMSRLVHDMLEHEESPYCPHGRPTRVRLDRRALERLFHR